MAGALTAIAAKPVLAGLVIGGLANKKDPVKGAIFGALGGSALSPALAKFTPAIKAGTHTVAAGDTLSKIASGSGTTVGNLIKANPAITDPNVIKAGQTINIPKTYGIKAGDTLGAIAKKQGTSVSELQKLNNITNANKIQAGSNIILPKGAAQDTLFSKLDTAIKDKPLESAQFATQALGGEEQAPQVSPAPYSPGGSGQGFGNVPSVEQAIAGTADSPRFIPKGLFDEGKQMLRDEEEMMMLQQQLQARGLV